MSPRLPPLVLSLVELVPEKHREAGWKLGGADHRRAVDQYPLGHPYGKAEGANAHIGAERRSWLWPLRREDDWAQIGAVDKDVPHDRGKLRDTLCPLPEATLVRDRESSAEGLVLITVSGLMPAR